MKVVILSRKGSLHSTKRLKEETAARGHEPQVVDPLKCVLSIRAENPDMLRAGRSLRDAAVVIPRVGSYATAYILSVIRQFELMGIPTLNDHGPIARAKNKLGSLQLLAKFGVPIPDTLIARVPVYLSKQMKLLGGPPVILKMMRGSQGTGVILAETERSVTSVLETIWSLGEDIMMQRYIAESGGSDIRALVLGGRVVASMRRIAAEGEFRANIHRGGRGEAVELGDDLKILAVRAAEAIGLRLAGVDILESKEGPRVLEVNASPGFEGLEEATGQNIARAIVEYSLTLAKS